MIERYDTSKTCPPVDNKGTFNFECSSLIRYIWSKTVKEDKVKISRLVPYSLPLMYMIYNLFLTLFYIPQCIS